MNKNLFATALTYPAPSANYRGESELTRTVIQKVTDGRHEYPIISPEAIRNALREILCSYGLNCNRTRLHPVVPKKAKGTGSTEEKQQLAVTYEEYPAPEKYIDDFFFGYLLAIRGAEMSKCREEKGEGYPLKRDSILRMNLAKGLSQYRHDTVFTQSPQIKESPWKPGGEGARATSALLHRETAVTAFQYPFAFNLNDVFGNDGPDEKTRKKWLAAMLRAIAELCDVAGNQARSLFQMAPASIVIRLTERLVPGYDSYGFKVDDKGNAILPEIVDGITNGDYPGEEFYLGGIFVKQLGNDDKRSLEEKGVHLFRMADKALAAVSREVTGIDFLQRSE